VPRGVRSAGGRNPWGFPAWRKLAFDLSPGLGAAPQHADASTPGLILIS